jgi:hypothetical protein
MRAGLVGQWWPVIHVHCQGSWQLMNFNGVGKGSEVIGFAFVEFLLRSLQFTASYDG